MYTKILKSFCFLSMVVSFNGLASAQTQVELSVTTNGPVGLAPAFAAFHDGSYDIFSSGSSATAGLELLAELGDFSGIASEATTAGATNAAGFAPGGPFAPNGGTGSMMFSLTSETHLSLAAMLLPSNDWFIGTPDAVNISSLLTAPMGTVLSFDLINVYDAGTEAEDFAFAPGGGLVGITTASTPPGGSTTTQPVSLVMGADPFANFANIEPAGFDTTSIDFTGSKVATVQLTVVPEPSSFGLIGTALMGLFGFVRRKC